MDERIRESIELWLAYASPQEIRDLIEILLREIGKRSVQPAELAPR